MRNLYILINTMLTIIPEDELSLRVRLHSIQNSIPYTAPEAMVMRWNEVGEVLNEEIIFIETPWQIHLQKVFSGEEES